MLSTQDMGLYTLALTLMTVVVAGQSSNYLTDIDSDLNLQRFGRRLQMLRLGKRESLSGEQLSEFLQSIPAVSGMSRVRRQPPFPRYGKRTVASDLLGIDILTSASSPDGEDLPFSLGEFEGQRFKRSASPRKPRYGRALAPGESRESRSFTKPRIGRDMEASLAGLESRALTKPRLGRGLYQAFSLIPEKRYYTKSRYGRDVAESFQPLQEKRHVTKTRYGREIAESVQPFLEKRQVTKPRPGRDFEESFPSFPEKRQVTKYRPGRDIGDKRQVTKTRQGRDTEESLEPLAEKRQVTKYRPGRDVSEELSDLTQDEAMSS